MSCKNRSSAICKGKTEGEELAKATVTAENWLVKDMPRKNSQE